MKMEYYNPKVSTYATKKLAFFKGKPQNKDCNAFAH
jgi:hypothetical protein